MIKQAILCAVGAASLALPGAVSAQAYQGQGYGNGYGYGYTDQGGYRDGGWNRDEGYRRGGDYYGSGRYGWNRFSGYPEFRGVEQHIRSEIIQGQREDMIDEDGAQDLLSQLRDIKLEQSREFQRHGWRLPDDDRYRIRSEYERLDREVDRIREEPQG